MASGSRAVSKFSADKGKWKHTFLELGVGYNTPGIIKYPFWQMTAENRNAVYVCINHGDAACPSEIKRQAACIDGDIGDVLCQLGNTALTSGKQP